MSRETSHGHATVTQLCAAMTISRQAYYAAARTPVSLAGHRARRQKPASRERSHASQRDRAH